MLEIGTGRRHAPPTPWRLGWVDEVFGDELSSEGDGVCPGEERVVDR